MLGVFQDVAVAPETVMVVEYVPEVITTVLVPDVELRVLQSTTVMLTVQGVNAEHRPFEPQVNPVGQVPQDL